MKITRSSEIPFTQAMDHGKYQGRRKALGGEKMSAGLWELPPGKTSFPLHAHHVTEEAMFVISGTAKVRTPEGETPIGPGDYVSFPPGGPAHQIVNDGSETLTYVALSATFGVDIVDYPETGKVALAIGSGPNRRRNIFRAKDNVDYWDGEE